MLEPLVLSASASLCRDPSLSENVFGLLLGASLALRLRKKG